MSTGLILPTITLINGKPSELRRMPTLRIRPCRTGTTRPTVSLAVKDAVESPTLTVAGLLYNLFADRELGLDLVPQSVYDMQSEFYPTIEAKYGVPLDTRHDLTKSKCFWRPIGRAPGRGADLDIGDWELFTASIASDETRDLFIQDLATWITETPTNLPLTDLYDTTTGE